VKNSCDFAELPSLVAAETKTNNVLLQRYGTGEDNLPTTDSEG
jgi:hypothetical protein